MLSVVRGSYCWKEKGFGCRLWWFRVVVLVFGFLEIVSLVWGVWEWNTSRHQPGGGTIGWDWVGGWLADAGVCGGVPPARADLLRTRQPAFGLPNRTVRHRGSSRLAHGFGIGSSTGARVRSNESNETSTTPEVGRPEATVRSTCRSSSGFLWKPSGSFPPSGG